MPKVLFISYSHDSDEHCAWVKRFADDLSTLGDFEILLDQNLPKGFLFTRFMELGLQNADKVLVIGTPKYKEKAVTGSGVAFEEAIIGTELMRDIDSTKYYPILRSGSYEESFPPILQGRKGDDISDDAKYSEVLKSIAESLENEQPVPSALVGKPVHYEENKKSVGRVDFSVNVMFTTYFGKPTGNIEGVALGVEVTNMTKEVRYFNQPLFKLSIPISGSADSFTMLNMVQPMSFPVRLDFGQQYFVSYKLVPGNMEMFQSIIDRDPNATITVMVSTSLGEKSESEPFLLSELVKNKKYVR